MSNQMFRLALRASKLPRRTISSSSACAKNVVLDQKLRDEIYPKIGNREVVGFGMNGETSYVDNCEFPCPAIRFREPTPDIAQLLEKEKGDWKKLTLDEKKALYRVSFCQTFSEIEAPTGEWKSIAAMVLFAIAGTGWLILYMRKVVYPPAVSSLNREWQEKSLQKMLDQGQGSVTGISSKWDYDKQEWKK